MSHDKGYILADIEDVSDIYKKSTNCHINININQIKSDNDSFIIPYAFSFKERLKKYKFIKYIQSTFLGYKAKKIFFRSLSLYVHLFSPKRDVYDLKNISELFSNSSMETLYKSEKFYPSLLKSINNLENETGRFYKHQQVPTDMHITPEVYYTKFTNVTVIGGSNFIIKNNTCLAHDQYRLDTDTTSEELHDLFRINRKEKKVSVKRPRAAFSLNKAAVFTDACSPNYAHWMTEVLPRIILFLEFNKDTDISLVLDSNLHVNMYNTLFSCINKPLNIFLVDKNIHLHIKELHYVSTASYVPFGFLKPFISIEDKTGLEGRHNRKALIKSKDILLKNNTYNLKRQKIVQASSYSRLYIKRLSDNKMAINRLDLDKLMVKYNFSEFDTTKASFSDQVVVFSNADIVLGNTSAALVNMMFMKPGSKLYILMANSEYVSYYYWQNLADIFNIDINFILGSVYGELDSSHPNFTISIVDLEEELKKL